MRPSVAAHRLSGHADASCSLNRKTQVYMHSIKPDVELNAEVLCRHTSGPEAEALFSLRPGLHAYFCFTCKACGWEAIGSCCSLLQKQLDRACDPRTDRIVAPCRVHFVSAHCALHNHMTVVPVVTVLL